MISTPNKLYHMSTNNDNNTITLKNKLLMANNLNKLGINGVEFCNKIKQYGCLMAGSYPLQCLLGEFYPDSDIDIFIKEKSKNFSIDNKYYYDEFETWLYEKYGIKSVSTTYAISDIIRSRKTQITKLGLVNIVIVSTENLHEYVNDHFDLSFCQTTFDGDTFRYNELSLKKIGYRTNQGNLLDCQFNQINSSKNEKMNHVNIEQILNDRLEKYKNRGFIITYTPLLIHSMTKEELLDMVVDQFQKNTVIVHELNQLKQDQLNNSYRQINYNYELEQEVKKLRSDQLKQNCELEEEVKNLKKITSDQLKQNCELEQKLKKLVKFDQLKQNYEQEVQKLKDVQSQQTYEELRKNIEKYREGCDH